MQVALVCGHAHATVKHPTLSGCKLLLTQPLLADGVRPDGAPMLAVDRLGAGPGDYVMITSDGAAIRELLVSRTRPSAGQYSVSLIDKLSFTVHFRIHATNFTRHRTDHPRRDATTGGCWRLMSGISAIADTADADSELVLRDRVVTLSALEGKLQGKSRVRVHPRAVVTPAVVDELKRFKVELVRDTEPTKHRLVSSSVQPQVETKSTAWVAPILVCGSAVWFESLSRHLCPKQAFVRGCDDASAIEVIKKHQARGGSRVVWLSPKPFAANVAVAKSACCTAVILPGLGDLNAALEQADPECLILDASRYTVAAIGNLVRAMFKRERVRSKE